MILMRLGSEGAEIPCVLDESGKARDVSLILDDFSPETIPLLSEVLGQGDLESLPNVEIETSRVGTPMSQPRNILCIGLNYSDHAAEAGMPIPTEPILFNKSSGAFCAPGAPILHSSDMTKLDWEVELGLVIGKPTFRVGEAQALDYLLGYTLVNDVSERSWQMARGGQWAKGKSFPNFCPTGPLIASGDELNGATSLDMWLNVNGERMQTGNTSNMIFKPATIVSHLSQFMRLEPGDLICTGTPPGVGAGKNPPVFLKPGDRVTLGIEGLGEQRHEVVPL